MASIPRAALLALVLVLPSAAAFSATQQELSIVYEGDASPVIVSAGSIALAGELREGLLVGGSDGTRLPALPDVTMVTRGADAMLLHGATLEVHSGGLLWLFDQGALSIDISAPYGIALALPQAPLPSANGEPRAGFLLAGEGARGTASWPGGTVQLVPLDAVITLRDAAGQPIPEWDARRVNAGAHADTDTAQFDAVLRVEGAFRGALGGSVLAGATGDLADLALTVGRAEEDRFSETAELLGASVAQFAQGDAPDLTGGDSPLAALDTISGLLNGALLVVPGDGTSAAAIPREARWGAREFDVGELALVRGDDLEVTWREGEMRVHGEPTVALGRAGFAVDEPARVGIFPMVSLVLWALAAGAVVVWLVKRPPKGHARFTTRLISFAFWLVALVAVLYLWDRSFTDTFGTGVLQVAREHGVGAATLPRLGVLAALELVPWGIAGLLFALPVRIALGIGLRYLGAGKSYKGIAAAGGLLSLAILGPMYALFCFNLVWARASALVAG